MSKLRIWSLILTPAFVIAGLSAAQVSSQPNLTGMVSASDGKPMEGVAVSARANNKTFTTTVYTDLSGAYSFPSLDEGRYSIWAQAVGFEEAKAEQAISSGKKIQQNFSLKRLQDFSRQLSGDELMASIGGDTPQDQRMKTIFINNCTGCHELNFPLQNRFDARGWGTMVNLMSKTQFTGLLNIDNPSVPMINAYKEELVGYLTQVRGPSSPLNYKLVPRPTGAAAQAVITEFDFPPGQSPDYISQHSGSIWSEGVASAYEGRGAHDAVVDQHGIVWFTDQMNPERTIGSMDPRTGKTTGYKLPGKDGDSVGSHGIGVDRDGMVWFTNLTEGTFTKLDPRTGQFTRFPRPDSLRVGGVTLDIASDGMIWGNANSGAIKLDPKTGEYTAYKGATSGGTYGCAVDRNGNAWYTLPGLDRVGMADHQTGTVTEVVVPPLKEDLSNDEDRELGAKINNNVNNATPRLKDPRRMAADKNGNYVWVAEYMADQLARIDINTKEIKEYPLPHRYTQPYSVVVDKNHMVWIALMNTDRVARFDPAAERFTEYTLPTRGTEARFISVDNYAAAITVWLPYNRTNKLTRIQLRSANPTIASAEK